MDSIARIQEKTMVVRLEISQIICLLNMLEKEAWVAGLSELERATRAELLQQARNWGVSKNGLGWWEL